MCVKVHTALRNCVFLCIFKVFDRKSDLTYSSVLPQNTKVTTTDRGVTTTSFPTALRPHKLSLQLSPLTSWALDPELWRDRATILQTTKGSRTWSPMQKPPARSRAYPAPCILSQGRRTAADPVLPSPWPVTPATALLCPTKDRRWEKPQPGKRTNHRDRSWAEHQPS